MIKRIFLGVLKWIRTKITLVEAFIFFETQLPTTLDLQRAKGDTLKEKDKNIMSGSNHEVSDLEKDLEELESILKPFSQAEKVDLKNSEDLDVESVERVLQKILETDWGADAISEVSEPLYMLELGKDSDMAYSVNRRTYVPVQNHVEVIPVEDPFESGTGSFFYVINNEVFDIDDDKVVCTGWN